MTLVSQLGEFGLIDRLLALVGQSRGALHTGPGDDACAIELDGDRLLIATTDILIEGIHFRLDWQSPEELGHKSVAVNISDIAAMGGETKWILVTLGCSREMDVRILEGIYRGMVDLCEEVGATISGGDTSRSDKLLLSITALGTCAKNDLCKIAGAKPGEKIYSTSCPGVSALGLRLLQEHGREGVPQEFQAAVHCHLRPQVPWHLAPEIARTIKPGAMTDISDGLARDIGKICAASKVGARIDFSKIDWDPLLIEAQKEYGWDPTEFALAGGEDYCLLFTADENSITKTGIEPKPVEIGEVLSHERDFLVRFEDGSERKIDPIGFDHFGY